MRQRGGASLRLIGLERRERTASSNRSPQPDRSRQRREEQPPRRGGGGVEGRDYCLQGRKWSLSLSILPQAHLDLSLSLSLSLSLLNPLLTAESVSV